MKRFCICFENDFSKCPYPNATKTVEEKGFKDEPNKQVTRCDYQLYIGASVVISNFTKKEYYEMVKENTLCVYLGGKL
jgi:hypothetical protein